MDLFKRILGLNKQPLEKDLSLQEPSKTPSIHGNDFKKPLWYEEESDDELFDNNKIVGFQMFSNPIEIQKYHEQQLERLIKTFKHLEGAEAFMKENWREENMKPGFVEEFSNFKPSADIDLDGEIYADHLHSLLQGISSVPMLNASSAKPKLKQKLSDDEKILDQIHGIDENTEYNTITTFKPKIGGHQIRTKVPNQSGTFEGFMSEPKMHRQTYSYQYIRRPDGTTSTKTVTDSDGNTKTTIKKFVDGQIKTQTFVNGIDIKNSASSNQNEKKNWIINYGRHIYVNENGYALPKNLW